MADIPAVAVTHHTALKSYLSPLPPADAAVAINAQRQSAREKLTRLTDNQFHELSTDVYDEMTRRVRDATEGSETPFLEVRAEYHQKRNQARQKLATLSRNRFKDLSSDVFFELERRYPDLNAATKQSNGQQQQQQQQEQLPTPPAKDRPAVKQSQPLKEQQQQQLQQLPIVQRSASFADGDGRPPPPYDDHAAARSVSMATAQPPATSAAAKHKEPRESAQDMLGMVNFTSLDNLMADLGNMIATSIDGGEGLAASTAKDASPAATFISAPTPPEHDLSPTRQQSEQSQQQRQLSATADSRSSSSSLPPQQQLVTATHASSLSTSPSASVAGSISAATNILNRAGDPPAAAHDQSGLHAEIDKLKRQLHDEQKQRQQSAQELAQLHSTILSLKRDVEAANGNRQRQADQMQRDFDEQTSKLRQQVRQLEAELESRQVDPYLRQIADLESELERRDSESERQQEQLQQLNKEKVDLQKRLDAELAVQLSLRNDANESARLMILNQRLQTEKQELESRVTKAESELTTARESFSVAEYGWKQQMAAATKLESGKGPSNIVIDLNLRENWDSAGMVAAGDVLAFQQAIGQVANAGQNDDPTTVLTAMKSIVLSTRRISEKLDQFEATSAKNPQRDNAAATSPEQLTQLRNGLSVNLTELMAAAKSHATGTSATADKQLQKSSEALSADISRIVRMVKLAMVDGVGPSASQRPAPQQTAPASSDQTKQPVFTKPLPSDAVADYAPDQVKAFLEQQTDQIVQNIHTLLQAMRQATFDDQFHGTITNITTVVSNLVGVSRRTLAKPAATEQQKSRGAEILQHLDESNTKLSDLGRAFIAGGAGGGENALAQQKPGKQKLAAAAYEVAKFTKELVSLFDMDN